MSIDILFTFLLTVCIQNGRQREQNEEEQLILRFESSQYKEEDGKGKMD